MIAPRVRAHRLAFFFPASLLIPLRIADVSIDRWSLILFSMVRSPAWRVNHEQRSGCVFATSQRWTAADETTCDVVAVGGPLIADPTATFGGDVVNEGSFLHVPGQRAFHVRGVLLLLGASVAVAFIVGLFVALLGVVIGIGVVVMSGLGSRPDWLRSRFRADDTHEAPSS
jgi:hypothetical protein